ncbi:hypothetical protein HOG98_03590 [bacterium]|jgi:hypothetical protein|nr:hypothetical protein [bacterium]
MGRTVTVIKKVTINKDINSAWVVLGKQFAEVHIWSSTFSHSKPAGDAEFPGLSFSRRITVTNRGETIHIIDMYDPESHSIAYHITKGIPSIAKTAIGLWSLEKIGPNQTTAIFEFQLDPRGILGSLLKPVIRKKLSVVADHLCEEFKFYLENGIPHHRKSEFKGFR